MTTCQGDRVCTNPRCPTHGIEWNVHYTAYLSDNGYAVWDHVKDELVAMVESQQHADDLARQLNGTVDQ